MGDPTEGKLSDVILKITTGGRPYEISIGDFSAMDEADYKIVTKGRTIISVFMGGEIDSIAIAGLVWLLRRRTERKLAFEAVASVFKISDLDSLDMLSGDDAEPSSNGSRSLPEVVASPEG